MVVLGFDSFFKGLEILYFNFLELLGCVIILGRFLLNNNIFFFIIIISFILLFYENLENFLSKVSILRYLV